MEINLESTETFDGLTPEETTSDHTQGVYEKYIASKLAPQFRAESYQDTDTLWVRRLAIALVPIAFLATLGLFLPSITSPISLGMMSPLLSTMAGEMELGMGVVNVLRLAIMAAIPIGVYALVRGTNTARTISGWVAIIAGLLGAVMGLFMRSWIQRDLVSINWEMGIGNSWLAFFSILLFITGVVTLRSKKTLIPHSSAGINHLAIRAAYTQDRDPLAAKLALLPVPIAAVALLAIFMPIARHTFLPSGIGASQSSLRTTINLMTSTAIPREGIDVSGFRFYLVFPILLTVAAALIAWKRNTAGARAIAGAITIISGMAIFNLATSTRSFIGLMAEEMSSQGVVTTAITNGFGTHWMRFFAFLLIISPLVAVVLREHMALNPELLDNALSSSMLFAQNLASNAKTLGQGLVANGKISDNDPAAKIRQLGELRDQGLLTDAQFDEARDKVLQCL